jgi:hypothetical protein
MCEHDFQLDVDGQVTCIKCFARDDEMELPSQEHSSQTAYSESQDFWATQTSFEE